MSIYRSQVKLLSHILSPDHSDIEIHTADRFQGRDKEVVIISLVRSNPENYVGDLLQDWRRVNVAFTRAKSKLIIFGSRSTIRDTKPLDEFVKLVESKGWVYRVPHEAALDGKGNEVGGGRSSGTSAKENVPPSGHGKKIGTLNGEAVLKGRAVLRDIVNEHR
jgi:DNA replication ATP-dependent helicase Dna2